MDQDPGLFQTKVFVLGFHFFISNIVEMIIHLRDQYIRSSNKVILP